jgi:hypothetical protein
MLQIARITRKMGLPYGLNPCPEREPNHTKTVDDGMKMDMTVGL